MAKIPKRQDISELIESGFIDGEFRDYLGYSGLGHKCKRYLWYQFRWCYDCQIPRRVMRIYKRGDIEEPRVIEDLLRVGCTVTDSQKEVKDQTGHARGHIDGIAIGVPTAEKTPHLFECKTMKASSYKEYIKKGLRIFNSAYWQQIQSYMGHLGLTRCLYVVVNKDTEERNYQRIEFDEAQFREGEGISLDVITSNFPPERMAIASKIYYECKWCDAYKQCFGGAAIKVTCRTCEHVEFENDGKVSCGFHGHELDKERQLIACDSYKLDSEISS